MQGESSLAQGQSFVLVMFQRNVGYDAYESVDPRDWKLRLDMPVLVGATNSLSPYAQWNMEIAHREYVVDGFEYLPRHILMRFSSLVSPA